MAERKAVNKYYPPEWRPEMGSINKFRKSHPLRKRASRLGEGIMTIRFEMPYNIWCLGCGIHIAMGVRYNADKRKVGMYYSTQIYKFSMRCHLCPQIFEIQTDPKNCEYQILSGARRKESRWNEKEAENIQLEDYNVRQKMSNDPMFKLEHDAVDVEKSKSIAPVLNALEDNRKEYKDDFGVNYRLRKIFRHQKATINQKKNNDDIFKKNHNLPEYLNILEEQQEDVLKARSIKFGKNADQSHNPDDIKLKNKQKLIRSSIFSTNKSTNSKQQNLLQKITTSNVSTKKHSMRVNGVV